jgi:hypothetical protein
VSGVVAEFQRDAKALSIELLSKRGLRKPEIGEIAEEGALCHRDRGVSMEE